MDTTILCHITPEIGGHRIFFRTRSGQPASRKISKEKFQKFMSWVNKTSQGISVSGLGSQRRNGIIFVYRY